MLLFVTGWNANIEWVKLDKAESLSKEKLAISMCQNVINLCRCRLHRGSGK